MTEKWLAAIGFEGRYEASSFGRIRSVRRTMRTGLNNSPSITVGGRVLKAMVRRGYEFVSMRSKSDTLISRAVHRIVCEAFHGPKPSSEHQVNHRNGVKNDNRPDNLEWCTPRQNTHHSIDVLGKHRKGECNGRCKLTKSKVLSIRLERMRGRTLSSIAMKYDTSISNVAGICSGTRWSHIK